MFTSKDLHNLALRPERQHRSVLTVHTSLYPGSLKTVKKALAELGERMEDMAERARFRAARKRVDDVLSAASSGTHGLAIIVDETDGFLWTADLFFPVHNSVHWDHEPFLQLLIAALDEFQPYAVVLLDRTKHRIFVSSLEEIEELDQADSAPSFENVIRHLDEVMQNRHVLRLILAGTPEIIDDLSGVLPKRLRLCVLQSVTLKIDAEPAEVLRATRLVAQSYERETETQLVQELAEVAADDNRRVVGLEATLEAINQGRVWQLAYSAGFRAAGAECPGCLSLFPEEIVSCEYCGKTLVRIDDIVERAVEHAYRSGSSVEVLRGTSIERMNEIGCIGAFVRNRLIDIPSLR